MAADPVVSSEPGPSRWARLDRYLLTHAPTLWVVRVHWVAVGVALLSLIGLVIPRLAQRARALGLATPSTAMDESQQVVSLMIQP